MINKSDVLFALDKRIKVLMDDPNIDPSSRADRLKEIKVIQNEVESLPDDQPDLLPFQWPIKEGYEVVTRDGRKVVKIDFWDLLDMPVLFAVEEYSEPFTALPDGRTCLSRQSEYDLFLRRKEKKVWVVEWPDGYLEYYPTMDHADRRIWSRNLPESTDRKHGGEPKKYEATLKPVV